MVYLNFDLLVNREYSLLTLPIPPRRWLVEDQGVDFTPYLLLETGGHRLYYGCYYSYHFKFLLPRMVGTDPSGSKDGQEATSTKLPPELRDLIWGAVAENFIVSPKGHEWIGCVGSMKSEERIPGPLLYVSRQVSGEFQRRLYKDTVVAIAGERQEETGSRRASDVHQVIPEGALKNARCLRIYAAIIHQYDPLQAVEAAESIARWVQGVLGGFERLNHVLVMAEFDSNDEFDEEVERQVSEVLLAMSAGLNWQGVDVFVRESVAWGRELVFHWREGARLTEKRVEGCLCTRARAFRSWRLIM